MTFYRLGVALVLAVLVVVGGHARASAQTPGRQQATDLANQLMSPFCPGKLLADCTSPNAGELRDVLAKRFAAGESMDAVKADLVRQYGREILASPPAEGIGLLAWLIPGVLGLLTAAGVALKVAHAARNAAPAPVPAAAGAVDRDTLARVDDELRDLD